MTATVATPLGDSPAAGRRFGVLTGLVLLLAIVACGRTEPAPVGPVIDAEIQRVVAEGIVAGAAVAVVRGENTLHARAYGLADIATGRPATANTIFNLGSVTKMFTGVALVSLAESGALSLDDPLSRWVPEFPNPEQSARITLRQLINHSSGLSDHLAADLVRFETTGEPMPASFVFDYLRHRPLDFAPGTHWSYTNSGFYLAGMIIQRASGMPWERYIAERVLAPLGVDGVHLCDDVRDIATRGYARSDSGLQPHGLYLVPELRGDGGLCASALGLARFPGRLSTGPLVSPATLATIRKPTRLSTGVDADYGLGVRLGNLQGRPLWGHTGGHAGTVAAVAHFPEDSTTIAVLINTIRSERDALALLGDVAVAVFGLDTTLPRAQHVDSAQLARYAGRYRGGREGGWYEISADSGGLAIRWSETERTAHYRFIGGHSFVREGSAYPLDRYVFQEVDGRIVALSDYYNGLHGHFRQRIEQ